jgi:hypothetical protein
VSIMPKLLLLVFVVILVSFELSLYKVVSVFVTAPLFDVGSFLLAVTGLYCDGCILLDDGTILVP